jgi:hypothetical protein
MGSSSAMRLPPGCGREQVLAEVLRDGGLEVSRTKADRLVLTRRRNLGNRGVLRLLFPKCTARVTFQQLSVRYAVRLDGLGFFMLFIMIGGVLVELLMDRTRYPREYPPAFPYALAALYVTAIVVEVMKTKRRLDGVLSRTGATP